jgi:MoxR-like ATPase
MFYGPGGHGKSDMIRTVFDTFNDASKGTLECNPSTKPTDLYGGAVAQTHKISDTLTQTSAAVNLTKSFLSTDLFSLEEMLDMPPKTQASLKVTLTQKGTFETSDGTFFPSKNLFLVGATNVNPRELLKRIPPEMANSYKAFMERFLVVKHGIDVPSTALYRSLMAKVIDSSTFLRREPDPMQFLSKQVILDLREDLKLVAFPENCQEVLGTMADSSNRNPDYIVSPRTFNWAISGLQASALLEGRKQVLPKDFDVLEYFGFDPKVISEVREVFEYDRRLNEARQSVTKVAESQKTLDTMYKNATRLSSELKVSEEEVFAQLLKPLGQLKNIASKLDVPDEFHPSIRGLNSKTEQLIEEIERKITKGKVYPTIDLGIEINEEGEVIEITK